MLTLGAAANGTPVQLSDQERSAHIHILGQTQSGKSNLIEAMVRQDIGQGRGLCLIDPHGQLSDSIERWICSRGLAGLRRVHLIKPGDEQWTAGFNPLRLAPGEAPTTRVDAMVSACVQVWGGQDMTQTPRLRRVLRALFFVLAVRELTLAEAPFLLNASDPEGTRRALTRDLPNAMQDFVWEQLNALTRREFAEITESAVSRISAFLESPSLRLMVGQRANVIDFKQAMDNGEIVIFNLASRDDFTPDSGRILGALAISDIFQSALTRDRAAAKRRPFALYIDEAHDYLTGDIGRILDQTAKFGVQAVIAHQRLGQLHERGVFNAVMGSTRTKIALSLADQDTLDMSAELFRDQWDPTLVKHVLDKPVVVGQRLERFRSGSTARSSSTAKGENRSTGRSESEGYSSSHSRSASGQHSENYEVRDDQPPELVGTAVTAGDSESDTTGYTSSTGTFESEGTSEISTVGTTEGEGWHDALVDVREWLPTATVPLAEQQHVFQVRLRDRPKGAAVVKRMGKPAVEVQIPHIKDAFTSQGMVARFRQSAAAKSPFLSTIEAATLEIETRQRALGGVAAKTPKQVEFWQPE